MSDSIDVGIDNMFFNVLKGDNFCQSGFYEGK